MKVQFSASFSSSNIPEDALLAATATAASTLRDGNAKEEGGRSRKKVLVGRGADEKGPREKISHVCSPSLGLTFSTFVLGAIKNPALMCVGLHGLWKSSNLLLLLL